MGKSLTYKIIEKHLTNGKLRQGEEIGIKIDQTLTQDITGTLSYMQFEAMRIPKVKTELSVSYVDHNTLQNGYESADDHRFLQSVAAKYGIYFSKAGNGICHQVHLERFGIPGETLLGSDSHTPTGGGLGMLAIGAGGLDVAVAMAGGPFYLTMPKIVNVILKGKLKNWVSAKDVILELLKQLSVKGGVGKIYEYTGDGVCSLTVPERATITNMGAELGLTTSVFPSDKVTREFLVMQKRGRTFKVLCADKDADYDGTIEMYLDSIVPLVAMPHSPDNVKEVNSVAGKKVNQVIVGSCTNSSFQDLMIVARILKGKKIHPEVDFVIAPGSRQVLQMLVKNNALNDMISAGARIIECACGPCIGMGQAPNSGGVTVRTFNRNFEGRSGTRDAEVYLASPATAVVTALKGVITDPRTLGKMRGIKLPKSYIIDDNMIIPPKRKTEGIEIVRGPNIKPLPVKGKLEDTIRQEVVIKLKDNITTDDIIPAGSKILPLRSNVPEISKHVFERVDAGFYQRILEKKGGIIVGGTNYGQGSSREHAAIAPMYLGVKFILAKSYARIHKANLVNFGIIPFLFANESDYEKLDTGDQLEITGVRDGIMKNIEMNVKIINKSSQFVVKLDLQARQREILLSGGLLNYIRARVELKSGKSY